MTPPRSLDVLDAKVRQLEVRVAQLVDVVDIYGPPPRRPTLPIPELTPDQRRTIATVTLLLLVLIVPAVYTGHTRTQG